MSITPEWMVGRIPTIDPATGRLPVEYVPEEIGAAVTHVDEVAGQASASASAAAESAGQAQQSAQAAEVAAGRAEAVGDTNDAIMTAVAADAESAFAAQLSATIVSVAEQAPAIAIAKRVNAYRGNPALGQSPIVMDVAPTITMTGGSISPRGTGVPFLNHNTTAVSKRRGRYAAQSVNSNTYQQNYVNNPSTSRSQGEIEFDYSGDGLDIKFHNSIAGTSGIRLWVNEQLAQDSPYATAADSTTGPFWATIAFASTTIRRLRVEMIGGAIFGGITMDAGDTVVPIPERLPKCAVFGDSWVGGAGNIPDRNLLYTILGRELGWETARLGQGGSGYDQVGSGAGVEYGSATRLSEFAQYGPDFAIIIGSINDNGHSASVVGAKAAAMYAALAEQSPQTALYIVGPQFADWTAPATTLANRDALKAVALTAPNVVAFIDPIAGQWITEANKTTYMLNESGSYSHLNNAGHLYFARKIATEVLRVGPSAAL